MHTPPKVTLLMAQTLDGRIAQTPDHFPDWTAKGDKKLFAQLTKQAGVMVMGRTTYDTIGRPLPGRLSVVMTRNKNLVSADPNLVYTNDTPEQIMQLLASRGYSEIIIAGGEQINSLWLAAGLIDEIIVTINPIIFGTGLGLFAEGMATNLALISCEQIDQLIKLHYRIIK